MYLRSITLIVPPYLETLALGTAAGDSMTPLIRMEENCQLSDEDTSKPPAVRISGVPHGIALCPAVVDDLKQSAFLDFTATRESVPRRSQRPSFRAGENHSIDRYVS